MDRLPPVPAVTGDQTCNLLLSGVRSSQLTYAARAVIFLSDVLREKRSVPQTKQPGVACFKTPVTQQVNIAAPSPVSASELKAGSEFRGLGPLARPGAAGQLA